MADIVSKRKRSEMMAGIKGKNTRPEILIRKGLHARGFRFRLHDKKLPGKPDLVLPKYRAVIFVNGCFWHMHDCHLFKWPKTREEFWRAKLHKNRGNDQRSIELLMKNKWRVLVIWECAIKGRERLKANHVIDLAEEWINSETVFKEARGQPCPEETTQK